jgi:DNA-binding TFAR19-related protein (PDSD5 family)
LQKRLNNKMANEEQELVEQVAMLEKIAKTKMSKEAISRYGNVKLAHTETAIKAIAMIAQAIQMGQVQGIIGDMEFKEILREIQRGKKTYNFRK